MRERRTAQSPPLSTDVCCILSFCTAACTPAVIHSSRRLSVVVVPVLCSTRLREAELHAHDARAFTLQLQRCDDAALDQRCPRSFADTGTHVDVL